MSALETYSGPSRQLSCPQSRSRLTVHALSSQLVHAMYRCGPQASAKSPPPTSTPNANDGSSERRRSTRSGPAPAFAAAANKPVGSEHTQSKPLDLTGSTLRGASVKPADTDTGLFPAGTAVVHPQRGTGLVVEVHRQDGERKPWRVRYESGAVLRYPLAAMRKMTDNFFDGRRLEDPVISLPSDPSLRLSTNQQQDAVWSSRASSYPRVHPIETPRSSRWRPPSVAVTMDASGENEEQVPYSTLGGRTPRSVSRTPRSPFARGGLLSGLSTEVGW